MSAAYAHGTIAEISAAVDSGEITLAHALTILRERARHDSPSGRRAARWVAAHTGKPTTHAPKATPAPKAPHPLDGVRPAHGLGSRSNDPWKVIARADTADMPVRDQIRLFNSALALAHVEYPTASQAWAHVRLLAASAAVGKALEEANA